MQEKIEKKSVNKYFNLSAKDAEQITTKLSRWVKKLESTKDPIDTFHLNEPSEFKRINSKFTGLLSSFMNLIEQEWIEERLDPDINAEANLDLEPSEEIQALKNSNRGQKLDPRCWPRVLKFPDNLKGRQKSLADEFKIHELPELSKDKAKPHQFRVCKNCEVEIWNRGWMSSEYLEQDSCPINGNHLCNKCFAEGNLLRINYSMVMVQRFSVNSLISSYRETVSAYNKWFIDRNPHKKSIDKMEDVFENQDPRPKIRSPVSICYHLNLRLLRSLPYYSCHHCKTRRPSYNLCVCCDPEHAELRLCTTWRKKYKSGFFYCIRCISEVYGDSPIEVFADRSWCCYGCQDKCTCRLCRKNRENSGEKLESDSPKKIKLDKEESETAEDKNSFSLKNHEEGKIGDQVPDYKHNPNLSNDSVLNVSVGRMIHELQMKCQVQANEKSKLLDELESMRQLCLAAPGDKKISDEVLELKRQLKEANEKISNLESKNKQLKQLQINSSTIVVPNLQKISKILTVQASTLVHSFIKDDD